MLSDGGQNGEGGQVDDILRSIGIAEHLHGPR